MIELNQVISNYGSTKDESMLENFRFFHNGKTGYYESFDINYWNRKNLILKLYENYGPADKPLIKWLLNEELKASKENTPVYTVDLCAFMLYKYMETADIYTLYDAKFAGGTDLQVYIDIELVFGFDKDQTIAYLRNSQKEKRKSKKIISAIAYYEQNPDAKFKSRAEYIEHFETRKIHGIRSDLEELNEN